MAPLKPSASPPSLTDPGGRKQRDRVSSVTTSEGQRILRLGDPAWRTARGAALSFPSQVPRAVMSYRKKQTASWRHDGLEARTQLMNVAHGFPHLGQEQPPGLVTRWVRTAGPGGSQPRPEPPLHGRLRRWPRQDHKDRAQARLRMRGSGGIRANKTSK